MDLYDMKGIYVLQVGALMLTSCVKDDALIESFVNEPTMKSLDIKLTDSSGGKSGNEVDFQGLEIDLQQIRIKTDSDSSSWLDLETNAGIYDLVSLQFGEDSLVASGTLLGDSVKEIRLILGDMNRVLVDSVWHDITIPSASQSGLKVKLNPAIYLADIDSLMIDFDSNASVKQQGNGAYKLHPVIHIQ
jgi:hypothetical protein